MTVVACILAAVIIITVWRPYGLSLAVPALLGAFVCLGLGRVTPREVLAIVATTWNALAALVGLMLLSAVLEASGIFRALAHRLGRRAAGRGLRLYLGLCGLSAAAAVLLANDGAVLLVTPVCAELAALFSLEPAAALAWLFSTGFLCDALSTVLPTSNLTNLLAIDALHLGLGRFLAITLLPALVTFVIAVAALGLLFRRSLPRELPASLPAPPALRRGSRYAALAALLALGAGYGLAARFDLPLGLVVLGIAFALAAWEHHAGTLRFGATLRRLSWGVLGFAFGLFVIVAALDHHWAARALERLLDPQGRGPSEALFAAGGVVALLSALINNLPALMASLLALLHLEGTRRLPFAVLLGANIGNKLTPVGSLSTLLWLELLRSRGRRLSWRRYLRLAWFPTLVCLAAALSVLAL